MQKLISRCGYRCDLCLAFKADQENQKRFKVGLLQYYNYRISIKNCYCDGCLTEDCDKPILIDSGCKVRSCVLERGLENCSFCRDYPCDILREKFVNPQNIVNNYGKPIPDEDFNDFIKPYDNKRVLDELRG